MKTEVKLEADCAETKVIIIAEKMTQEISDLMQRITEEAPQAIAGFDGDDVLLLEPTNIVRIYSAVGKVFAVADGKEYVLRLRLYEAEERLSGKGFVRISNSEIICVSLSNGDISFVSRRYVTKIKKTLGI